MGNRDKFVTWVEGYIRAWNSNDPKDIGSLFSEDATYLTGPFDTAWEGREQIVEGWIGRKDDPGTWTFKYDVLAADDPVGTVRGFTQYMDPPQTFSNIWLIKLNENGEATEFNEWKMEKK